MRILEDGMVEIRSNKGNVKIVKPDELPNYGIPYTEYQKQQEAYKIAIEGEAVTKNDPLAPQKAVAADALGLLENRYGRGDASNVGTEKDLSLAGGGGVLRRLLAIPDKWFSGKDRRNDINSYENLLETFLPAFTQAFGSGAPQEGEAKRLVKSAPNARSSDEEAKRWFTDVRALLTGETPQAGVSKDDEDLIKKYKNYGK